MSVIDPSTQRESYESFADFYADYLAEHQNPTSRRLHVLGTLLAIALVVVCLSIRQPQWLLGLPVVGYGFAWVGHLFFEKNTPTTFRHPLYSLRGDFTLLRDVLTGRIPF